MTILDDELRSALRVRAQALRVPERPALDRDIDKPRRHPGPRWLTAAACLALIAAGVVALTLRGNGDPEPAPPVASVVPDTTAPAQAVPVVPDTTAPAAPSPEPRTPPSEAEVNRLLNGFLDARVAGEGAQPYLETDTSDVPLLYATSSGAPYERAEFEPVLGIEWPYGFMAFKVRLFAGDTVVEQLFFIPHDDPDHFPADGRLRLEYQSEGFGTGIAPTTEDGQPVAVPNNFFDGAVTLQSAHPWILSGPNAFGRLIPEGPGVRPTTDGAERNDWDELFLMADPVLLGTDCQPRPGPADAAGLAESIRSDRDLGATAPVAISVGGADALVMDVKVAAEATICLPATDGGDALPSALLRPVLSETTLRFVGGRAIAGHATGEWMRLYLFDAPEGSSMRILAIAIVAPESSFERAVAAAAPVVDSVEFHAS